MNAQPPDFTLEKYISILKSAADKYTFISYEEIDNHDRFILLRHDLDFSVHRALKLATAEYKAGVKSTYFFQLSSSFYNVFEEEIKTLVEKILSFGHMIGLHFDCNAYKINSRDDLERFLVFEKNALEVLCGVKIKVFSFHNPGKDTIKYDEYRYGGMINTYAKYFRENVVYCSDSNGYWRHESYEQIIEAGHRKLQILIHPGWWQDEVMMPRDRIKRCVQGRAQKQLRSYDDLLMSHGRSNIGK